MFKKLTKFMQVSLVKYFLFCVVLRGSNAEILALEFKINYPKSSDKEVWLLYPAVKGIAKGKKGCKVEIYIKTDKEYHQGSAWVEDNDSWVLPKSWPTSNTKNVVYAKLYEDGEYIAKTPEIVIYPVKSSTLDCCVISAALMGLATREVNADISAPKWLRDFLHWQVQYRKAQEWKGTIQGMQCIDEALEWLRKARKREGKVKDLTLDYRTEELDPFSRTVVRVLGRQITVPERLVFKIAAVGITVASGGALSGVLISSFAPDVGHEVANILEEEKVITSRNQEQIDFLINVGTILWNIKGITSAPSKERLVAEASKLGMKLTNYVASEKKCNFVLRRNKQTRHICIEIEK